MKKYLFVLPLIISCNGLGECNISDNVLDNQTNNITSVSSESISNTDPTNTHIKNITSINTGFSCRSESTYPEYIDQKMTSLNQKKFLLEVQPEVDQGYMSDEDGIFIKNFENNDKNQKAIIGVLDGVGGAKSGFEGVKCTMALANKMIESDQDVFTPSKGSGLQQMLYRTCNKEDMIPKWGSTVCLVSINGCHLQWCNLGDSRMAVVRGGKFEFITESQHHGFNYPYQLNKNSNKNPVDDCIYGAFELKSGDIVILATDGIWDNLYESDVISCIQSGLSPKEIAYNITEKASKISKDPNAKVPFNDHLYEWLGKCDKHARRFVRDKLDRLEWDGKIGKAEEEEASDIIPCFNLERGLKNHEIVAKLKRLKEITPLLLIGGKPDSMTAAVTIVR